MRRKSTIVIAALAFLLVSSVGAAADKWLHVKVEEKGDRGERVNVNIPLSVVENMLPLITVDELREGRLHLDLDDLDELEGIDLREIAKALRDTPDADFVTVQSEDESVRVAKEDGYIVVVVEENGKRSSETVRVRMPLDVVDALVGSDPHELDLVAALRVLGEHEGEALVDVKSDDATVRVWIDRDSGS